MVSAIVLAAAAVWIFVLVMVVAVCKDAKAGDEAMGIAQRRAGVRAVQSTVRERVVSQRDREARKLPRLA